MAGAVLVVLAVVIVLPVLLCLGGAVLAVVLGSTLRSNGERTHAGSELIDLNR
jgi:hypothetical protein